MATNWRRTTVLVLIVAMVGCGRSKQPWETVYPVSGSVKFKGKPIAGAIVTLVPSDQDVPTSVRPSATTDENGDFELGTYSQGDGAPAGQYKAVVLHFPVVGKKESPSAGPNDLPAKYARAESSDLTVEVEEGGSDLKPLELN